MRCAVRDAQWAPIANCEQSETRICNSTLRFHSLRHYMLQEVFVPGRLCVLGEHSDWAAEYRGLNGAVAYGELIPLRT